MEISPPFRWNASATSTPNRSSTSGMTTRSAPRRNDRSLDIRRAHAYFKHSKCPYLAASRTSSSYQGHPCLVRVLQTLQMSMPGGIHARHLVPRTPVLVRVLQTLQMSILGGIHARPLVPRTPVLVRVLQTLQMSIPGGIRARPRPKDTLARARTSDIPTVHSRRLRARPFVPRTPVLVRVLQTLQMSILGGILARPLVPITPLLVRVLQTLQMSILGGTLARLLVPSTPVARARTSNSPDFHSWRQTRTSTRPTAPRARARTSNILNPCMRVARTHAPACTVRKKLILPLTIKLATVANPVPIDAVASQILSKTTPPHPTHRPGRARVHG